MKNAYKLKQFKNIKTLNLKASVPMICNWNGKEQSTTKFLFLYLLQKKIKTKLFGMKKGSKNDRILIFAVNDPFKIISHMLNCKCWDSILQQFVCRPTLFVLPPNPAHSIIFTKMTQFSWMPLNKPPFRFFHNMSAD